MSPSIVEITNIIGAQVTRNFPDGKSGYIESTIPIELQDGTVPIDVQVTPRVPVGHHIRVGSPVIIDTVTGPDQEPSFFTTPDTGISVALSWASLVKDVSI
jgi:hypothetical protein